MIPPPVPPPLQIEREQEEIMKMPDRFYKKFQKDVKQLRVDLLRRWARVTGAAPHTAEEVG